MKGAFVKPFILSLVILAGCSTSRTPERHHGTLALNGMVVSAHSQASAVGVAILQQGGNAVDAAAAVHFALAVCYPTAGNIGGGGFMVARFADGSADALDFREKAPLKGYRDMYLDDGGEVMDGLSETGHLSCGIPGSVAGILLMHEKYGLLPVREIIQPAIDLARNGFLVAEKQASSLNQAKEQLLKWNDHIPALVHDSVWNPGDLLVQEELAATLERIRDKGRDGFYKGLTAECIVDEMERGGGLISYDDLESYEAIWRPPLT